MLLSALKFVFIVLEVLLIFNLLIIVHELGHFLAARWRGLVVEKFGIWFGKPIWQKKINGVVYSLGSIPAGGFVALPQLAPMETIEGESDVDKKQLPPITPLDKIIVALAGPVFSFGLAIVFAVIVWGIGRPVSQSETTTVIGFLDKDSPAYVAGLRPGDDIQTVDNQPVTRFGGMTQSVVWHVVRSEGDTIPIEVKRGDELLTFDPIPFQAPREGLRRRPLRQIGIAPAETPMVAKLVPGSPAEKAGFKPNDLIVTLQGAPVYHRFQISETLAASAGKPVVFGVKRGDENLTFTLTGSYPRVESTIENSPARAAGLQKGDEVVSLNGEPVSSYTAFSDQIAKSKDQPVTLGVRRGTENLEIEVVPRAPIGEEKARLGLAWSNSDLDAGIIYDADGELGVIHPNPIEQVVSSVQTIVNTLGAIFSPKSSIKAEHLGGPLAIMRIYYQLFESDQGWRLALWFSVVLNVNLALLNLLPFPVLDGGHITLALIEAARRKPLKSHLVEKLQTACALLLIGYILYVSFFDVQDFSWPWSKPNEPAAQMRFAPPPD